MKSILSAVKWHTWIGLFLSIPILIVGITAILIPFEKSYKNNPSEPQINVSWLPGYSSAMVKKDEIKKKSEIKCSFQDARINTTYIGTKNGLYAMKDGQITRIKDFKNKEIWQIGKFKDGIYVATNGGLYHYEKDDIKILFNKECQSADFREDGSIVVSTGKKIFTSLDNGQNWQNGSNFENLLSSFNHNEGKRNDAMMEGKKTIPMHKFVMDLHTGKALFGKSYEMIWILLVGVSCCILTLSGVWMWLRKLYRQSLVQKRGIISSATNSESSSSASPAKAATTLSLLLVLMSTHSCKNNEGGNLENKEHKTEKVKPEELMSSEVPLELKTSLFKAGITDTAAVKWKYNSQKEEYEAIIGEKPSESKIKFTADGIILKKETHIDTNQIKPAITKIIKGSANYEGYSIYKSKIKEENGERIIEIELKNSNDDKYKLKFDTLGTLISEEIKEKE